MKKKSRKEGEKMAERQENGRYFLSGGAHLSVDTRRVGERHGRHWHRYFELELVLAGEGAGRETCLSRNVLTGGSSAQRAAPSGPSAK